MYCVKTGVCGPFVPSPVSQESGISLRKHQEGSHMFCSSHGTQFPALTPSDWGWLFPLQDQLIYSSLSLDIRRFTSMGTTAWYVESLGLVIHTVACLTVTVGGRLTNLQGRLASIGLRATRGHHHALCTGHAEHFYRTLGEDIAQKMLQSIFFPDVRVIWPQHLLPNTYLPCFMALSVYKSDIPHWRACPSWAKIMSYTEHMVSK